MSQWLPRHIFSGSFPRTSESSRLAEATGIRNRLEHHYDVVEHDVRIDEAVFRILGIRDTYALLDGISAEEFQRDERLPYWGDLWPSSLALARWCLAKGRLEGKRVLELGCGLGLAGMSAAHTGALVTMTDYEKTALDFAHYNILANAPFRGSISCALMDWRSPEELPDYDVVIGSDVLYEERNISPIVDLLLSARPQYAVFTDPQRRTGEKFINVLLQRGLVVQTFSTVETLKKASTVVNRHIIHPGR